VHPIQAVQIEYSPFTLDIEKPETGLLEAARELGVTIVAYSPLGRGMLTGKYTSPNDFDQRDYRRYLPRFSADNFPKNLQLVEKLKKIAAEKDIPVSTLILAWLLAQGDDIIPIPGASKAMNLDENQQALNVELSPDVVSQIRLLVDKADVAGTRYDVK
jgi:aryl-alcohol dehydrogenase-like predicted oxidoreductase